MTTIEKVEIIDYAVTILMDEKNAGSLTEADYLEQMGELCRMSKSAMEY